MFNNHTQIFLSDLNPGDCATVAGLTSNGTIKKRLLEMGFTRGATVKVEKYAPMGDPMELVIKGYHLSLRKKECQCILVVKEP
ncbi:MAG: ferrous iron transport protein A [Holophagales bacterium]|jgi:Fe2+ transport system protein FeoA|nr:ferrous iron transport protein A [Holophagales bacterium]